MMVLAVLGVNIVLVLIWLCFQNILLSIYDFVGRI